MCARLSKNPALSTENQEMRNLLLQGERRRSLSDPHSQVADVLIQGETVVTLSKKGTFTLLHDEGDNDSPAIIHKLASLCENDGSQHDNWFQLTFFAPMYVALSKKGAIVSVQQTGEADLVGEFENGIEAAACSKEILALVTAAEDEDNPETMNSVLLTMNSQWDVLAEVPIERIQQSSLVSMCWSADGNTLAVSSVDATDGQRKIRLYQSDSLELRALGRTEDGSGTLAPNLQHTPIAWAGGGCSNLIATIQKKGRKTTQVAFMEPNGLRHREFPLREEPGVVVLDLQWSANSDLLAVALRTNNCQDKIQLWHRSNYYWYQKYEVKFQDPIRKVVFHQSEPGGLLVLFDSARWIEYTFQWENSHVQDDTAFVVDGSLLNWTDFRRGFVPPPMYGGALKVGSSIREMAFVPEHDGHDALGIIYLSTACLAVCVRTEGIYSVVAVSEPTTFDWSLRSLVVFEDGLNCMRLACVSRLWDRADEDVMLVLEISWTESGDATVVKVGQLPLGGSCLVLKNWEDSRTGALVQLTDGRLFEYEFSDDSVGTIRPSYSAPLMEPCPWIQALKNPSVFSLGNSDSKRMIIGMTRRCRLYCQDTMLADSVSSYHLSLRNKYLVYVTAGSRCVLRFVPLTELCSFDPLLGFDDNSVLLEGYEPRNVERGSRLVAILTQKPIAVLQMPRGNLETVFPRALVLCHVISMCTRHENYKDIFEIMRRQKVDLNLLVDLDPYYFLDDGGIQSFVDQVTDVDHLNLFISSLQDFDSTSTKYKVPRWADERGESRVAEFDFSSKVNRVCQSIREVMVAAEKNRVTKSGRRVATGYFLLPILSSFAKEDPPQLENALALIRMHATCDDFTDAEQNTKPPLFGKAAQSAIQYLAFLANYELLYETSLSVYDYDMARAVARNSQMDPKVYLPLLKRFRSLPQYFGRFEVDMKLQRFESALRNLSKSSSLGENPEGDITQGSFAMGNDFETSMKLIESHHLHKVGLEIFGEDDSKREQILASLGEHLIKAGKAEAALCIFSSSPGLEKDRSIQAAKAAMNWRVLFALLPPEQYEKEAEEFVDRLVVRVEGVSQSRESLLIASRILLDYCTSSHGRAIELLIEAKAWAEASRIASSHNETQMIRKVVDAALSFSVYCLDDFRDRAESFETTLKRYAEVLAIRKEAIRAGENVVMGDDIDETGSQFSLASNVSNSSMQSTASTGSASSLSSVISVRSNNSFTISSNDDSNRHKSRFNDLGRSQKKKKKRKARKSGKARRGSEEELRELVLTLASSFVTNAVADRVSETILFLIQNSQMEQGRFLYKGYIHLRDVLEELNTKLATVQIAGEAQHPCEAEVNAMTCGDVTNVVHDLFKYLPSE